MKKITFTIFMMFSVVLTFAQVGISENFDSGTPAGWTDSYANTATDACMGNSERDNLWSFSDTGNLTSPNQVALSNGTDLTISFDYKIIDYSGGGATASGWGTADLQYSTDDGATWNTVYTIDDSNHTASTSCATVTNVIPGTSLPNGSDVKLQIANTWLSGDYYFYVDNFSATQVVANPPNCDATLTQTTDVSTSGDISWSAATGVPEGYFLTAGSTSGGTDLANNVDVGNVTSYNLGTLMAGTTYYVTITPYNSNGNATGCSEQSFTTFVPPSNDECAGAIALTVNEDLSCAEVTSATTQFATASPQPDDATGTPNTDVWFTFVATATNNNIVISNVVNQGGGTSTSTDMGMSVFDDAAGCNMTAANEVGESDPNTLQLSGLTIGNTYYVRVYGWQSGIQYNNFDICIGTPPPPPANDDCAGAIEVTTSEDANCSNTVSGTTESATTNSANGCSTTGRDVWYSFTAAEDGSYTITVDETFDSGFTSTYVSAYEGECGSLTQVGSSTSCFNTGDIIVSTVAGETYYVNVRSSSSTNYVEFDLCIYLNPPPPANDVASGAVILTLDEGTDCGANAITGISNFSTSDSGEVAPTCTTQWSPTDGNGDLWYQFVAPASDLSLRVSNISGMSSVSGALYSGTPGSFTEVGTCGNAWPKAYTGLNVGETYYLRVWDYGNDQIGTFDLCGYYLSCTPATVAYNVISDCDNSGGFLIEADITDMGSATSLSVEDDQGNTAQVANGVTTLTFGPYVNGTDVIITATPDDNALCVVTSSTLSQVACPPANDECSGAIELTVEGEIADLPSATQIPGTIAGATDSGVADPVGTANDDVWYSFTATSTDINIDVTDDFDGVVELFSGACGSLTSIEYDDFDGPSSNPSISRTDFVVGETYYVRVYYYYSGTPTSSDFTIALWTTSEVLSTQDFDKEATFTYYPNPVNNNLTLSAQKEINNVSVYNMVGQEVFRNVPNAMTEVVDMSSLQAGAYFVKVTIGNATKTVKVIKN